MITKYNVGDRVVIKGVIDSIHINGPDDKIHYNVSIYDGEAFGCNPKIMITEKRLDECNSEVE